MDKENLKINNSSNNKFKEEDLNLKIMIIIKIFKKIFKIIIMKMQKKKNQRKWQ